MRGRPADDRADRARAEDAPDREGVAVRGEGRRRDGIERRTVRRPCGRSTVSPTDSGSDLAAVEQPRTQRADAGGDAERRVLRGEQRGDAGHVRCRHRCPAPASPSRPGRTSPPAACSGCRRPGRRCRRSVAPKLLNSARPPSRSAAATVTMFGRSNDAGKAGNGSCVVVDAVVAGRGHEQHPGGRDRIGQRLEVLGRSAPAPRVVRDDDPERLRVFDGLDRHRGQAAAIAASSRNLRAMILTFGATPTTPCPSSEAAIVPATCVPWKSSSKSWTVLSSLQKSQPWTSSM